MADAMIQPQSALTGPPQYQAMPHEPVIDVRKETLSEEQAGVPRGSQNAAADTARSARDAHAERHAEVGERGEATLQLLWRAQRA